MATFKAIFDYDAEAEDELTLRVGDIITDAQADPEAEGWCKGKLNGRVGVFPDNFVEKCEAKAAAPAKPPPPKPAPPKPAPPKPADTRPKAKCMFEHVPEQDDELHIKEGDIVVIVDDNDPDWWKGELNGKVGMFPSNFVERIAAGSASAPTADAPQSAEEEEEEPRRQSQLIAAKKVHGIGLGNIFAGGEIKLRKTGMNPEKKKKEAAPAPATAPHVQLKKTARPPAPQAAAPAPAAPKDDALYCKVLFEYEPQQDDELAMTPGDVIRVVKKNEDEGWWQGELNGKTGWFPDNFVEMCPAPSADKNTPRVALKPPGPDSRSASVSAPAPRTRTHSLRRPNAAPAPAKPPAPKPAAPAPTPAHEDKPAPPAVPKPAPPKKAKPPPSLKPKTAKPTPAPAPPAPTKTDTNEQPPWASQMKKKPEEEEKPAPPAPAPAAQKQESAPEPAKPDTASGNQSQEVADLKATVDTLSKTVQFLKKKLDHLVEELDQERLDRSKLKLEYERRLKDLELKVGI
ncbi:hypothetical protein PTSG_01041 [Salpingoeca rosetta]|uniref:SH3 domain-containing protein n=1 Tax=Salpingoeca rosetta (strain ATCC 50818 / BSB-021) TaxID=946362 RepID=F2TY82_SALR5|nr:uncharacterized protein PTSG_01041 [Salpingoeca rosetta]EGD76341.1 hypothetical protein PTSG_01041 [Salpingoeca rosetta]|eukprot:XP_004998516.1 hypothetical protein PTSG_01041 [Salpingoeca rosetta]